MISCMAGCSTGSPRDDELSSGPGVREGRRRDTRRREGLVAGAGFEPAVRQLPDYEPSGKGKPVMV
jgi:hypothetical protein